MEKELLKLASSGNQQGVIKLLPNVNLKQVLKLLHVEATRNSDSFVPSLRFILQGFQGTGEESSKSRFVVYQFGLNILRQVDLPLNQSSEVVGLLLVETDSFQSSQLASIADAFLDSIQDGGSIPSKWLEVFPKVLMTLSSRTLVVYDNESWSGPEYTSRAVQKLLSFSWCPLVATRLASTFREIPLKSDELSSAIDKFLLSMNQLEVDDTSSLVYELLLLASKGHRGQVLEGIIGFFTRKERSCQRDASGEVVATSETLETLLQAEGTVILHITFACKQDQELGKEFLRLLKTNKKNLQDVLSPFCLSLALALTKNQRFEQQILDLLKSYILCCFRESDKSRSSWWMRENSSVTSSNPSDTLLAVAYNSKHGWDHVTQGLLRLALDLLDTSSKSTSLSDRTGSLAIAVLQRLFKAHGFVRSEIVEQLLNRRIMQSNGVSKNYIEALGAIVGSTPNPVSFSGVRPALESLPFLPHACAEPLLSVLMPLLRISPALRDTLILVVRKSLFRRDVQARKVAVCSFLALVKTHKILGSIPLSQGSSSSQVTVESSGENSACNEMLCTELLGILRRALTQQAEVREAVYQGLPEVLEKNSQLSDPVLALLFEQLQKYCSRNDVGPPLVLETCVQVQMDHPVLVEPLAQLLQSSQRCVLNGSADVEGGKLRGLLRSLVPRVCKAELEDFELDKSADYGNGLLGTRNRMQAEILLGVYESLMEFCLLSQEPSVSVCDDVLCLFSGRRKLLELLKDGQKKEDKKSLRSVGPGARSILALSTLSSVLKTIFCKSDCEESVKPLKENPDFLQHVIAAVLWQVQKHKEIGDYARTLSEFAAIARALSKCYAEGDDLQSLDVMSEVICLYKNQPAHVFLPFVSQVLAAEEEEVEVRNVLKSFAQKVVSLLEEAVNKPKEAIPLLCILQALAENTTPEDCRELYDSVYQLCVGHTLGDAHVAKSLVAVTATLARQDKAWPTLLRDFSFAIHKALGDIEDEVQVEGTTSLAVVTLKTAAAIAAPILQNLELGMEEIAWAIDFPRQDVSREHAICSRCGRLAVALKEMVRSALPLGAVLDSLLKALARFYGLSCSLAKHYIAMYASKTGHLYTNYEKLVKLLGTELTPNIYNLLTYIQVIQNELAPKKALDSAAQKAKVLRESRTIPPLIFAIEQYEQCLIRLSKKSKVNLMAHVKLSTSRDFRINVDQLQAVLAQEESVALAVNDVAEVEPKPKKARRKLGTSRQR